MGPDDIGPCKGHRLKGAQCVQDPQKFFQPGFVPSVDEICLVIIPREDQSGRISGSSNDRIKFMEREVLHFVDYYDGVIHRDPAAIAGRGKNQLPGLKGLGVRVRPSEDLAHDRPIGLLID